jgi:hypothetical protein
MNPKNLTVNISKIHFENDTWLQLVCKGGCIHKRIENAMSAKEWK